LVSSYARYNWFDQGSGNKRFSFIPICCRGNIFHGTPKSDLLDTELLQLMEKEIPKDIAYVFISSITQFGIIELKDILWQKLQSFDF